MTSVPRAILLAMHPAWWIAAALAGALIAGAAMLAWIVRWGRQGKAMLRTGTGGRRVSTDRMVVLPGLHKLHWVDLTLKRIELTCRGGQALRSADGTACELRACFVLRLRPEPEHVLAACDHFGIEGAGDEAPVREAFAPPCRAALEAVIGEYSRADLYGLDHQEQVKRDLAERLAAELGHGFVLDSVALEFFEPVDPGQLADGPDQTESASSGAPQDSQDDRSADSRAEMGDTA
jgi:uncharacterized membrane protein YqiK